MRVVRDWRHQTNKTQKTQLEGGNKQDRQSKHTKRGTARLSTFFFVSKSTTNNVMQSWKIARSLYSVVSVSNRLAQNCGSYNDANRPLEQTRRIVSAIVRCSFILKSKEK